jgi:hypothetical protein
MPVVKYSRRLGLCGDIFIPKVNQELMQIHRNYLDSPEKREADRNYNERIAGASSIMNQLVGYEK